MKCRLCDTQDDINRYEALANGWRLIEVYGDSNKYLVACPSHKTDQIVEAVKNLIDLVSPKRGKK